MNNKYILLKSKNGDVFWTTFDENKNYDDYEILFKSSDKIAMINQWRIHYLKGVFLSPSFDIATQCYVDSIEDSEEHL